MTIFARDKFMSKKISVIIPAAGRGRRFDPARNKIFAPLAGRSVFLRTIDMFASREDVCAIQLVAAPQQVDDIKEKFAGELERMNVTVTAGGTVRSESVKNALGSMDESCELVCIHDAVRPCTPPRCIDTVFGRAARTGAAILAWPLHGTVKKVGDHNIIEQTLDRNRLWQAQTPQVFEKELIISAYESGRTATDDAALVEDIGHEVSVVAGHPCNIKITTPEDLVIAEAIFESAEKIKKR